MNVPDRLIAEIDVAEPAVGWRRALPQAAALAETAARAVLADAGMAGMVELSIVLADDAMVRGLNRRWRGRDAPTNVLSFAMGEARRTPLPRHLGDVVLAFETVRREAGEQGKSLADHLRHLVVHGVLHLLGFDHEEGAAAKRMEAIERRILTGFGIADPYLLRQRADG